MNQVILAAGVYRFVVQPEQAGERLDRFLAERLDGVSRGLVRRMLDLGGVHVDGRRMRRCSLTVMPGQQIELHVDGLPLVPFQLASSCLLYQDRYLLAINKPAGIATQPTPARFQGTLYAALQHYFAAAGEVSLGMVQRLDRDTSGAMVFSIHPRAHKGLTAAFHDRRVTKRYLALVTGRPQDDAGEIRSLLARRRSSNRMVSVAVGGKPALTCYRVIERFADAALVEVEILTGRSHQIRIHLAEAGHPLLGDTAYGGPSVWQGVTFPRQMLHSSELLLEHPVSAAPLALQAPLPDDFQGVLQQLSTAN